MRILGIETSCDETGVAIYDDNAGLLANQLYSQIKLHADYGGVVPELASRDHVKKTVPLIQAALKEAGLTPSDIDGVAYTAGPGLVGALLVGATVGRSLAMAWGLPAVAVHHMECRVHRRPAPRKRSVIRMPVTAVGLLTLRLARRRVRVSVMRAR